MKTNVSIKFNNIEEYRVIEKKLEQMGYVNDKYWNYRHFKESDFVVISDSFKFLAVNHKGDINNIHYNNLEEFLTDNNLK